MRKEARLKKRSDFVAVKRHGRWWSNSLLTLRVLPNDLDASRIGFLVGRRVGCAVVRNRVKRRLREIARQEAVSKGWDVVVIARAQMADVPFADAQRALRDLWRRAQVHRPPEYGKPPASRSRARNGQ